MSVRVLSTRLQGKRGGVPPGARLSWSAIPWSDLEQVNERDFSEKISLKGQHLDKTRPMC
jgi:hypothetical protein